MSDDQMLYKPGEDEPIGYFPRRPQIATPPLLATQNGGTMSDEQVGHREERWQRTDSDGVTRTAVAEVDLRTNSVLVAAELVDGWMAEMGWTKVSR